MSLVYIHNTFQIYFAGPMVKYTHQVCWISNTYYLPRDRAPLTKNQPRELVLVYYQVSEGTVSVYMNSANCPTTIKHLVARAFPPIKQPVAGHSPLSNTQWQGSYPYQTPSGNAFTLIKHPVARHLSLSNTQ